MTPPKTHSGKEYGPKTKYNFDNIKETTSFINPLIKQNGKEKAASITKKPLLSTPQSEGGLGSSKSNPTFSNRPSTSKQSPTARKQLELEQFPKSGEGFESKHFTQRELRRHHLKRKKFTAGTEVAGAAGIYITRCKVKVLVQTTKSQLVRVAKSSFHNGGMFKNKEKAHLSDNITEKRDTR